MAATAIALQLTPKHRRTILNPSLIHFFSSPSASGPDVEDQNNASSSPSPTQSEPSVSSYFSDVKASLKHSTPQQRPRKPFSFSSTTGPAQTPSKVTSLEEIRKNLSEFRRRSAVPTPENKSASAPSSQPVSFLELYKRNVMSKGEGSSIEASKGGRPSFDAIRESVRQLRANASKNQVINNDPMSLSKFKESFKLRPVDSNARGSTFVIGGSNKLPESVFKNEMKGKQEAESPAMKTEFVKMYSYGELGEKLRKLRPEAKRENWFSLDELNERLIKLRQMEEKEAGSRIGGVSYRDLRDSLVKIQALEAEESKKQTCKCIFSPIGLLKY